MTATPPGGTFTMAADLTVTRFGYGAMQLAGRGVWGPPADRAGAIEVLRAAADAGVTHFDTSDYYGPHATNQLIRQALHPYTDSTHIVTKVGWRRDQVGGWHQALSGPALTTAVHDNLDNLGLDALDVVNLRVGSSASLAEPFTVLARLREEGLIKHLGVSAVSASQVREARTIAPVVCVQNEYNVGYRADDALIDELATADIAFVPFVPLGGGSLVVGALQAAATRLGTTARAVALAWLLQRSPNILLIPGTSSVAHLRDNLEGAAVSLPADVVEQLNRAA